MAAVFLAMLPSLFSFYVPPNVKMVSPFSMLQLIHGGVGFPAIVLGLIHATGDLPTDTKKWMRLTAVLWLTSIAIGVSVYITMPS